MARVISNTFSRIAVFITAIILTREISDAASAKSPPYVVKIINLYSHVCDGSIIAKDIILSDSECIKNTMPPDYVKQSPYWVVKTLFVSPKFDYIERREEGRRLAWDVSRIIYRGNIALLKLRIQLPEDTPIVELFGPGNGLKVMFEIATAFSGDTFFRKTDRDHYSNASSVDLRVVPSRYCQQGVPVRNASQICLRSSVPYYAAPIHGGPVILNDRQLAIVAPVEDTIYNNDAPFPHYAEYATYPSIIGAYDWIKSTMTILMEGTEVTNPQDYDIYLHV